MEREGERGGGGGVKDMVIAIPRVQRLDIVTATTTTIAHVLCAFTDIIISYAHSYN